MHYPPLQYAQELPTDSWLPEGDWSTRQLAGPVLNGVTYQPYTIDLYWKWTPLDAVRRSSTATGMAALYMRMTHGGGTFLYKVCSHLIESVWNDWRCLPDDALFAVFFAIWDAEKEGMDIGEANGREIFRKAFVEDRLKKRKKRNQDKVEVWIEPAEEFVNHVRMF